jgi:hypothetical protein
VISDSFCLNVQQQFGLMPGFRMQDKTGQAKHKNNLYPNAFEVYRLLRNVTAERQSYQPSALIGLRFLRLAFVSY